MARSNSFFGIRRGQAMGMVFSHGQDGFGNAQQITRALPESVANPRTASQQYSRMIASSVAKAYSVLKPLADHSTEGVSYGQQSMNAFLRRNQQLARQADNDTVGFAPYKFEDANVFAGCQLSKGSLPKCEAWKEMDEETYQIAELNGIGALKGESEATIAAHYGFENVGDICTLVALLNSRADQEYDLDGLTVIGTPVLVYARLKLKKIPTNTPVSTKEAFDALFDYSDSDGVTIAVGVDANQGVTDFKVRVNTALTENSYTPQQWCQVMSHTTEAGWKRSNSFITSHPNAEDVFVPKDVAEATYPVGTQKILNGAGM